MTERVCRACRDGDHAQCIDFDERLRDFTDMQDAPILTCQCEKCWSELGK